jgi:hypothetical protein
MKPRRFEIGGAFVGAVSGALALAVVAVLLVAHYGVSSGDSPSRGTAPASRLDSTLPSGVCPLSTDNLPVTSATKMEAKLVTFDVALASDPLFPFSGGSVATAARSQGPIRVANYFWVIAAAGDFEWDAPGVPAAGAPRSVPYLVEYRAADHCGIHGGTSITGLGAWPAWFDSMQGLAQMTIK